MKKLFTLMALLAVCCLSWATDYNVDNVVFKSGEKIYYDLRAYGADANIYNAAGAEYGTWTGSTGGVGNIIEITLTNDLTITATSNLFKSGASNWQGVKAAIPTTGQNMIISTDGATAHWGTYGDEPEPDPTFAAGETITYDFTAVAAGGCNYIDENGTLAYAASGKEGTTFDITFTKNVFLTANSSIFLKFSAGGWDAILYMDRPDNTYTIVKVAGNGKSFAWTKPAAPEDKFTVTLVDATEASVEAGATTGEFITAADKPGLVFVNWTGTDGISFLDATQKTTTVNATQAGTATANYRAAETINVYFLNSLGWETVACYKWGGTAAADKWPGVVLAEPEYFSNGVGVYKVSFTEGEYAQIIFDNNDNGQQSADLKNLTSHNGQCYEVTNGSSKTGNWLAELPAKDSYSLSIGAAGWATLSLPFAAEIPDGVEAYYVSASATNAVTLTKVEATAIPANEGVLIKKVSGESPYEFSGVASATAISGNLLHANLTAGTVATVVGATQYYKLLNGTHGLGWYLGAEDGGVFTLGANKAYLALSESQAQVRFVLEDMLNNGYVTALENKAEAVKANKTLVNGQLFILRDGKTFDVIGRIVK